MNSPLRWSIGSSFLLVLATAQAATWHVSPAGKPDGTGAADAPFAGPAAAVARAQPGDVIRCAGGTYALDQPLRLAASGREDAPIRLEAAEASPPHFDFSAVPVAENRRQQQSGLQIQGDYWQVVGMEVSGGARFGIEITGHHNLLENCRAHDNQGTGVEIGAPASNNLVLNCVSYRNVDRPTRGQNADGFGAKSQIGPGNIFRGCRAWENADDGFDLWRAPHPVRLEYCVAFRNGLNLWDIPGFTGNGNGIKVGGDFVPAAHVLIGCVVSDQPKNGFDQNNNTAGIVMENCTAIRCRTGFSFTLATTDGHPHQLTGCVGWNAPALLVEGTVEHGNVWQSEYRVAMAATVVPSTPVTKQGKDVRPQEREQSGKTK